jgi:metacaspase-1
MNRALLVGINKYPGSPLTGCVNDVTDMADFLVDRCGFASREIRLLTDSRSTTEAIRSRLKWLVKDAKKGDRLLFHYSGHGAQVATRDKADEVDGLDEVICPVDFDWTDNHMIRDKDFAEVFRKVPPGVEFVWVSDSCHSGDLSKEIPPPPDTRLRRSKCLVPPADIHWRNRVARDTGVGGRKMALILAELSGALVSGCRSDQTSADAWFGDRPNGALTYFLLRALQSPHGLEEPLVDLVPTVRSLLKRAGYDQEPQLEGSKDVAGRPFLSR